jgi:putative transposase
MYRRCIAVDEAKLSIKGDHVYLQSAVDVDSKRTNIPQEGPKDVYIVDRGPWYPWALERLGPKYKHERFGMSNRSRGSADT